MSSFINSSTPAVSMCQGQLREIPLATDRVPLFVRIFEVLVSASVLVLTSPLILIIALIIRWKSPGPVLFFQTRLGINGKPFTFVKFRTLYADAKQRFPELYAYKYSPEELKTLKFKNGDDPRVTPEGTWLRATSLDELPNFWNVLKGDMALVGPRPEIPEMMPYYTGEMLLKFTARPGITGQAQISGRGRLGFFETVQHDVDYVRRRSIFLDLKVIVRTIQLVVMQDGAF